MTALIQENGKMNLKGRLICAAMKGVKVTRRDFTVLRGGGGANLLSFYSKL